MLIVVIAGLVVAAYWDSFVSMWALWQTSDHRHGVLVFPIVAYLVWRLKDELACEPSGVDVRGLPLVVVAAAFWAVARLAGVQVAEHLAILAMIPAAIFAFMGRSVVRRLQFPLLFLLLALPVSDALVPYLMVITAEISMALLDISGIPVVREGQYFSLPGGNFVVADVCSGNRYLVTGVMVSLLFGYLTYSSIRKRLVLLAVAVVALVLANGLRAYIVMAVASATDMQYLGGRDHIYFGWLLFGIVMMLILWIGARYEDVPSKTPGEAQSRHGLGQASHTAVPMIVALGLVMLAITVKPLQADFGELGAMLSAAAACLVFIYVLARQHRSDAAAGEASVSTAVHGSRYVSLLVGAATMAVLLATPRYTAAIEDATEVEIEPSAFEPQLSCDSIGPWRGRWQPRFDEPDVQWTASFDCDGQPINLYIAAYASALQGKELVSSVHHVVPPSWSRFVASHNRTSVGEAAQPVQVMESVLESPGYRSFVWYWYQVGDRVAAGPVRTKYLQVLALIEGHPSGGAVYVLEAPVTRSTEEARAQLRKTAEALLDNSRGPATSAAR